MIVMLLSGLWHGAAWKFVIWGALHGIGSVCQKIFATIRRNKEKNNSTIVHIICVTINFAFVSLCWVFFRADSFDNAFAILKGLFTLQSGIKYIYLYAIIYCTICALGHIYVAVRKGGEAEYPNMDFARFGSWLVLWLVILYTLAFFYAGDTAFIYSQF
jgi:alginate O-acetyltransferase complex protein AlgI